MCLVPRCPSLYICPGCPYICAQVPAGFRSGSMAAWRNGRCARTLAPMVRPRSAAQWLGHSVQGLCGATDDNAADTTHACEVADAGVWSFATLGLHAHSHGRAAPWHEAAPGGDNQVTWHEAARACLRRCASCSRCRNVSISLRNEECSWCAIGLGVGLGVGVGVGFASRSVTRGAHRAPSISCKLTRDPCHPAQPCSPSHPSHTVHMPMHRYASCERVSLAPIGYRSAGIDGGEDKGGAAGLGEVDRQGGGATETGVGGGASEEAGVSPATASSVLDRAVTLLAALPAHTHPADDDTRLPVSSPPQPLLLLGVFSGSAARRAAVRCTWAARVGARSGGVVQLRFVVGATVGEPLGMLREQHGDELRVPVREGQRA